MKLKTKIFEATVKILKDGSSFQIRDIPTSKRREFTGRNALNPSGYKADAYLYQFRNWTGITDEDGNPLECNEKNLKLAIEHDLETLDEAMALFEKELESYRQSLVDAEKN